MSNGAIGIGFAIPVVFDLRGGDSGGIPFGLIVPGKRRVGGGEVRKM